VMAAAMGLRHVLPVQTKRRLYVVPRGRRGCALSGVDSDPVADIHNPSFWVDSPSGGTGPPYVE
jgi:hypothetical protein